MIRIVHLPAELPIHSVAAAAAALCSERGVRTFTIDSGSRRAKITKIYYGYEIDFSYFLERVEARNRMYIIVSCRGKILRKKILFFHDKN